MVCALTSGAPGSALGGSKTRGAGKDPLPHLLLYTGGFLQVGHAAYEHTRESQAILWSTHPKTGSRNLKGFPTSMGEACLPSIPCEGRRFQAANMRANFVLLL